MTQGLFLSDMITHSLLQTYAIESNMSEDESPYLMDIKD